MALLQFVPLLSSHGVLDHIVQFYLVYEDGDIPGEGVSANSIGVGVVMKKWEKGEKLEKKEKEEI